MHGLGNDFIIIDQRKERFALPPALIADLSNRKTGVGCDQFIVMEPSDKADLFMRIYNADASESGACGNATRCVAHLHMVEHGLDSCSIETHRGVLRARLVGENTVEVDMGAPQLDWKDIPLSRDVDPLNLPFEMGGTAIGIGNPHCVFFVDDLEALDLDALGPKYEHDPLFPERTNVEFVQILAPNKVRLRTWERSEGFTLACGSAACATVAAGFLRGLTEPKIEVIMDGGSLHMEYRESDQHILMTGAVAYVFEGNLLT